MMGLLLGVVFAFFICKLQKKEITRMSSDELMDEPNLKSIFVDNRSGNVINISCKNIARNIDVKNLDTVQIDGFSCLR